MTFIYVGDFFLFSLNKIYSTNTVAQKLRELLKSVHVSSFATYVTKDNTFN